VEREEKRVESEVEEMKNFRFISVLFVMLLYGGCNFLMGPDAPAGNNEGNLVIRFGGESTRNKAITTGMGLPGDVKVAMRYELTLTGPGGEVTTHTILNGENLVMTVTLGAWRIDARAYQHDSTTLAGTGSLSFTVIPGTNTVIVPMYIAGTCYEIISDSLISGGMIESNFSAAFPGTTITLTTTPDTDYVFSSGSFKYSEDGGSTYTGIPGATFTMPASDVTISAEFFGTIRYVIAGGTGSGLSWDDPSGDLQLMMDELESIAADGNGPCIVKMEKGTYKPEYKIDNSGAAVTPSTGEERQSAFMLRPGVQVWGGYHSTLGRTDADRGSDPTWITTLSGDIGVVNSLNDNAYHVVLGINIGGGTILDGLTISGGTAESTLTPSIMGKTILANTGGGMYLDSSSPVLINVTISGNRASMNGGGIYSADSSPVLVNTTVSGNQAINGGGIYNYGSSPVLVNVLISGNLGSVYGGGIYTIGTYASPVLINVTIAGNRASTTSPNGGGIYSDNTGQTLIRNSIIWGNSSGSTSGGIHSIGTNKPAVSYSIVQDSGGAGTGWSHPNADNGGGNAADPGSSTADSPFTNWQNPSSASMPNDLGVYTLNNISGNPAADTGNSGLYPVNANDAVFPAALSTRAKAAINAVLGKDLAGGVRKNGAIDVGAYER
jgi:parallel beta-helix repeat protein